MKNTNKNPNSKSQKVDQESESANPNSQHKANSADSLEQNSKKSSAIKSGDITKQRSGTSKLSDGSSNQHSGASKQNCSASKQNAKTSTKKPKENLHEGHRDRLRKRLLNTDYHSWEPHEVLEFLLFSSSVRANTNDLAHKLLNRFGSLAEVLTAQPDALMKIDGISHAMADSIILFGKTHDYLGWKKRDKMTVLDSYEAVHEYFYEALKNCNTEDFYIVGMDMKNSILFETTIHSVSAIAVVVPFREIAMDCLNSNAVSLY